MTVEYIKPVPLNQHLRVESRALSKRGRRLTHIAEIFDARDKLLARSRGMFTVVDPERVFGRKR